MYKVKKLKFKKKKMIKIGIDIDGVIANFMHHFSILSRNMYGEHLPILESEDEILNWDIHKFYPLTEEQIINVFDEINNMDTFWMQLNLIDVKNWIRFKDEFNNKEFEVYFITSRINGKNLHYQTVEWLTYNGWKNPQVIFANKKHDAINLLNIDYFIDDKLSTCEMCFIKTNCKVFIYDYPHNKKTVYANLKRLKNLGEFIDFIKQDLLKIKGG